jgi:hypothetical protein
VTYLFSWRQWEKYAVEKTGKITNKMTGMFSWRKKIQRHPRQEIGGGSRPKLDSSWLVSFASLNSTTPHLSPFLSRGEGPSMNRSGPAHKITPPARPGSILALSPTSPLLDPVMTTCSPWRSSLHMSSNNWRVRQVPAYVCTPSNVCSIRGFYLKFRGPYRIYNIFKAWMGKDLIRSSGVDPRAVKGLALAGLHLSSLPNNTIFLFSHRSSFFYIVKKRASYVWI